MLRSNRRLLTYFMVAVTVLAGGLNSYLVFAQHDSTVSLAHILGATDHHDHGDGHSHGPVAHSKADPHDAPACDPGADCTHDETSGHDCPDAHVHCCGSSAVAPCVAGLIDDSPGGGMLFALTSTVAAGSLSYPLLRPPRALG